MFSNVRRLAERFSKALAILAASLRRSNGSVYEYGAAKSEWGLDMDAILAELNSLTPALLIP